MRGNDPGHDGPKDAGHDLSPEQDALSESAQDAWFFFDRPLDDDSLVVDGALDAIPFTAGERNFLTSMRATATHLYEVVSAVPGVSLTLLDVLEGDRVTVNERLGSKAIPRHEWIAARVVARGPSGGPELERGLLPMPSMFHESIRGALYNLGHEVARNTIRSTLLANGLEPAPERGKSTSWRTFIQSHLGAIAGADFFTVEVLTPFGLVRYFVFFVIDIASRRVHIAGITNQPSEASMKQVARNLTDCADGFLNGIRYLVLDRDPLYTAAFRKMLKTAGVKVVRLPARSPNLNALAERFVRHLRHAITEYTAHYHLERNHQGLDNQLIERLPANTNGSEGTVRRRERLGGVLSYYYRDAA